MRFTDFPFGIISKLRNFFYDRSWFSIHICGLPIFCVGNITLGGNGKTPLVIYLANLLASQGKKPVVLSRGYGGSVRGPHRVGDQDTADQVGDEPLMLYRQMECPVVISRKRVEGAKYIEEQALGNVIILDDGFQHRALGRCVDILCCYLGNDKAVKSFREGIMFPFGRFREPKEEGLMRAQAIVFNSRSPQGISEDVIAELKTELPKHIKVFKSHLVIEEITSFDGMSLNKGQSLIVDAFCGLAQPQGFFSSIESFGLTIKKRHEFRDHHKFSKSEILTIIKQSEGRPIICSEKDAVKLDSFGISSIFVLKSSLDVEPIDEFLEFVLDEC